MNGDVDGNDKFLQFLQVERTIGVDDLESGESDSRPPSDMKH